MKNENLKLVDFNKDLYYNVINWLIDEDIQNATGVILGDNPQEIIRRFQDSIARKDAIIKGIQLGNEYIGFTLLMNLNIVNKSIDFHLVIGKKSLWNKGYGVKATDLIVEDAFKNNNLHKLNCSTVGYSERMDKLLKGYGFKAEGVIRDGLFLKNKYYNKVLYGLINKGD